MSDNSQHNPSAWGIVILAALLAVGLALSVHWLSPQEAAVRLQLAAGYAAVVLVFFIGVVILAAMITGRIDISNLLTEHGGGASTSRFQFIIFTFVIALGIVYMLGKTGDFPKLNADVLTLLGISASTYAVSKGIQAGSPNGLEPKESGPPEGRAVKPGIEHSDTGS